MKISIRGLAALGAALLVASLGLSQNPPTVSPTPVAAPASSSCNNYAANATETVASSGRHGLFGHFGSHLHPLPYHPAEPHGHGYGDGHGAGGMYGAGFGGNGGYGNGFGNGPLGHFDHSPFPTSQPGTVVFPQHPFARSPRDYFMAD